MQNVLSISKNKKIHFFFSILDFSGKSIIFNKQNVYKYRVTDQKTWTSGNSQNGWSIDNDGLSCVERETSGQGGDKTADS